MQKSVCANSDIKLILNYQEAVVVDDLEIEVIMEEFELGSIGNSWACSRETLGMCGQCMAVEPCLGTLVFWALFMFSSMEAMFLIMMSEAQESRNYCHL